MLNDFPDTAILAAVKDGGRTEHVADRLGILIRRPWVLGRLKRLEKAGLVRRNESYTYCNSIFWERTAAGAAGVTNG